MPPTKLHIDDVMYYKCLDCGKKYISHPPKTCDCCDCRNFNLVMGNDWWTENGNPVLREIRG